MRNTELPDIEWADLRETALRDAVAGAMASYVADDPVPAGDLVAVRVDGMVEAVEMTRSLANVGLVADITWDEGTYYARIIDTNGSDPDDVVFELGWHNLDVGTIPDTRHSMERCRDTE